MPIRKTRTRDDTGRAIRALERIVEKRTNHYSVPIACPGAQYWLNLAIKAACVDREGSALTFALFAVAGLKEWRKQGRPR